MCPTPAPAGNAGRSTEWSRPASTGWSRCSTPSTSGSPPRHPPASRAAASTERAASGVEPRLAGHDRLHRVAEVRLGHGAIGPGLEHPGEKARLGGVQVLFLHLDAGCQRVLLLHGVVIPPGATRRGCRARATSA